MGAEKQERLNKMTADRKKRQQKGSLLIYKFDAADPDKGDACTWSTVDGATILDALVAVTDAGALMSFSLSQDRQSLVLTIFHGGEKAPPTYTSSHEQMEDVLRKWLEAAQDMNN